MGGGPGMTNFFKVEMWRFWRMRKNVWIVVCSFLIFAGFVSINTVLDGRYQTWYEEQIRFEQMATSMELQSLNASIAAYESTHKDFKALEDRKALTMRWYMITRQILNEREPIDRLVYEIEREKLLLELYEKNQRNISYYLYPGMDAETLYDSIEVKTYLLKNAIVPLSSPFEMVGHRFISRVLSYEGLLIWGLITVLLSTGVFVDDMTSGAYKTLYSINGNRAGIIAVKWCVAVVNILGTSVVCLLIFTGGFYLMGQLGDLNYPVVKAGVGCVPWYSTVFPVSVYVLFLMSFLVTVSLAVGMKLKAQGETFIVMLVVFLFDFLLRTLLPMSEPFWCYYPLTGLNAYPVYAERTLNTLWGAPVVGSVFIGLFAVYRFTREDL